MVSTPPFSSPAGGSFAEPVVSRKRAFSNLETLFSPANMTATTPTTEGSTLVTKKEEPQPDVWDNGPEWVAKPESVRETDFATITLKGGSNESWIVLHPRSLEEAEEIIEQTDRLAELMGKVASIESTFKRLVKAANGATGASGGASKASGGSGWGGKKPAASGGSKYECEHGERDVKTGRSAKGDWKGYFCPEKVCDPVWG